MTVVLWIINIVLASAFGVAGVTKLVRPMTSLVEMGMGWVAESSERMVRSIGALEIVAAVGLIVPESTGIARGLTPLAAIGLAAMMLVAVTVHLRRAESVAAPMILGGIAVVSAGLGFALL